jgi:hypothetical protein
MKYILVDTNTNEVILITEKYTIIDYLLDGGSVIINKKYYESYHYGQESISPPIVKNGEFFKFVKVFESKLNEKKEKDAEMFDNILTQLIRNDKLEDLLDEEKNN